jgi:group I intron endonuclease
MNGNPKDVESSGIYQILNTANGKRYIGSAIRISKRWAEHRRDLQKGTHHSVALQKAWHKYGPDNFAFSVVELCDVAFLIQTEQRHIDERGDYNICRVAGSRLGLKHSPEAIGRMKAAQAKIKSVPGWVSPTKGKKYSRDVCERMAAPKRGRKRGPMSDATKAKLSAANKGVARNVGRPVPEATRQKLRDANLGKKKPLEQLMAAAKLDEAVVRQILQLRLNKKTYLQISEVVGVGWRAVERICLRRRYKWVDPHIPPLTAEVIGRGGYKQSSEHIKKVSESRARNRQQAIASGAITLRHPPSEEQKTENRRRAAQAAWAKRKAEGFEKRTFTDEHKKAISESRKAMFASGYKKPDISEETRQRLSAAQRQKWESEEYRAKVSEKIKEGWKFRRIAA